MAWLPLCGQTCRDVGPNGLHCTERWRLRCKRQLDVVKAWHHESVCQTIVEPQRGVHAYKSNAYSSTSAVLSTQPHCDNCSCAELSITATAETASCVSLLGSSHARLARVCRQKQACAALHDLSRASSDILPWQRCVRFLSLLLPCGRLAKLVSV